MFINYEQFLEFLEEKLNKFFDAQKSYICCKDGCSLCCQNAQFPFSLLEFRYLLQGTLELPVEISMQVDENIKKILKERKNYKGEQFLYNCPFLINNSCCIYKYRGIVCRTFGLLTKSQNSEKTNVPFCCFKGLNYSNICDKKTKKLSGSKMKKLGITQEPIAYNVSYSYLTGESIQKAFQIDFGEKKPLIDWFINDYNEIG